MDGRTCIYIRRYLASAPSGRADDGMLITISYSEPLLPLQDAGARGWERILPHSPREFKHRRIVTPFYVQDILVFFLGTTPLIEDLEDHLWPTLALLPLRCFFRGLNSFGRPVTELSVSETLKGNLRESLRRRMKLEYPT